MGSWIGSTAQALAARRTRWRRARNLHAGRPAARDRSSWPALAACAAALLGAVVLAGHARYLGAAVGFGSIDAGAARPGALDALHAAAAGMRFVVPSAAGVTVTAGDRATVVVASGLQAHSPVRINLCEQVLRDGALLPVRIGYQFDAVAGLLEKKLPLRNVVLAPPALDIPQLKISGTAGALDTPLAVSWSGREARWAGDAGNAASFRQEGWLIWQNGAVRVQRITTRACPKAGELLVQSYRASATEQASGAATALVVALPVSGEPASVVLPPGSYEVPLAPRASLEDQRLFEDLLRTRLLRLTGAGLIDVAPRDLAAWQSASQAARAQELAGWPQIGSDDETAALFKRLYRMADGAYVREQVRIFNNERRLLAWRVRPTLAGAVWRAQADQAPALTETGLPLAAARLFAELPQGWAPWQRIGAWPGSGGGAEISVDVPTSAPIELLLVGQLVRIDGGRLAAPPKDACTGRACRSASAVQQLRIDPLPGARAVSLTVAPLAMATLADGGNRQYRHLYVANGRPAWRALGINSAIARAPDPAPSELRDRHGALLWRGGQATPQALQAGLGPLVGLRDGHAASISGMLARLEAPKGQPHQARLTLDLALQKMANDALDCAGLRRGRWNGSTCTGAQAVPAGRHAGMVIIDTASGDILAAASAGMAAVSGANWDEVRDFDRANPDRSPLRLPALQHDGGAHRSPGSTFKIISALGLELAAQDDPQLDALLAGMTLPAINRMALHKGFAFQTAAASYPVDTRQARITNYRDGQLDRRARDGRLGLSEALTYSLNTWFAWSGELSDRSLLGRPGGGAPDLQALEAGALDSVRPIVAMAHRLGFEQPLRLDGGLLPPDFRWQRWDALQPSEAHIDPVHTRHELRQMAIGLRMQTTPLHMAMVAGAVGEGRAITPRLLLALDGGDASPAIGAELGVRLDRVRAGMKGVVNEGTAAGAFRAPHLAAIRRGLSGKTGTSPSIVTGADGVQRELATVWFTGWLEPGSIPGEKRRLALAAFVSHSDGTGGEHAAPVVAAVLGAMAGPSHEQTGK